MKEPADLARVRGELQRLGYLSHRFERLLLQDALAPRPPFRALLSLAAKVGLLVGSLLAALNALALGAANRLFAAAPVDLLVLFGHLFLPLALAAGSGFLALAALFLAGLRQLPRTTIEPLRLATATVAAALAVGAGVARGWRLLVGLPRPERALAVLAIALAGAWIAKLLADALLAFEIRLTRWTPAERFVSRRHLALGVAASVGALALVAAAVPQPDQPRPPASLPRAPGERLVVVGVDGVLPEEIDYLLQRGDLPALADRAARGGVTLRHRRDASAPPAAFWTTLATGLPPSGHGVVALDSFRPLGLATPLARNGPWRPWWQRIALQLGLAEYRPLLSHRRRAPTVWELASRGGEPVVAVGWWATYPAEALPGLVVAHGAYQLLQGSAEGAVEPPERLVELQGLARETVAGPFAAPLEAALPAAAWRRALDRAILPDRFYRAAAVRSLGVTGTPRVVALYQPSLDILAEDWTGGDVSLADLVRVQLHEVDGWIGELSEEVTTILVVFDPGRRGGGEGRSFLWRRGCQGVASGVIAPEALGALLLRAAGLPQSRQLPEPPPVCPWPSPPAVVATFGERRPGPAPGGAGEEYLESLRSLGYL